MGPAHGSSSNSSSSSSSSSNGSTLVKALDRKARLCLRSIERSLSSPSALEGCEDPSTMTIDFLWARLQAQRAEYKAEKQRTQQLAKRVLELEQKLQSEIKMRTRAAIGVYGCESRKHDPRLHSNDREIESEITEESVEESTGIEENVNYILDDGVCIVEDPELDELWSDGNNHGTQGVTKHTQEAVRRMPDHKDGISILPDPSRKSMEPQQVFHKDIERTRTKEYTLKELNVDSEPDGSQIDLEDSNRFGVGEEDSMHIQAISKEIGTHVCLPSDIEHSSYWKSNTSFKFDEQKDESLHSKVTIGNRMPMELLKEGKLAKQFPNTRHLDHDHGLSNYHPPESLGSKMMYHPKLWAGRSINNQGNIQAAAQTIHGLQLQMECPQRSPYMSNHAEFESLFLPGFTDRMHIHKAGIPCSDEHCLPLSCFSSETKNNFSGHQKKLIGYRIDNGDRAGGRDYQLMNFGHGASHIEQATHTGIHLVPHQFCKRCPPYAERMQPLKCMPRTALPQYVADSKNEHGGWGKERIPPNNGRQVNTVKDVLKVLDVAKQQVLMSEKAA